MVQQYFGQNPSVDPVWVKTVGQLYQYPLEKEK